MSISKEELELIRADSAERYGNLVNSNAGTITEASVPTIEEAPVIEADTDESLPTVDSKNRKN